MPIRPKSIVQFEQVYWASIILGLIAVALNWDTMLSSVELQATVARFGMAMVYVPLALGLLVQVVLWYFITRRASVVAKWIFVVLTALGLLFSVFSLFGASDDGPLAGVLAVVQIVLQVIAIVLLFRPDARAWFGEDASPPPPAVDAV